MAEGVVAGPAVRGAGLAVIVLVAHHVVRVAQLALVAKVHVLGPVVADGQSAPGRQPAHEVVLVFWMSGGGKRRWEGVMACVGLLRTKRNHLKIS